MVRARPVTPLRLRLTSASPFLPTRLAPETSPGRSPVTGIGRCNRTPGPIAHRANRSPGQSLDRPIAGRGPGASSDRWGCDVVAARRLLGEFSIPRCLRVGSQEDRHAALDPAYSVHARVWPLSQATARESRATIPPKPREEDSGSDQRFDSTDPLSNLIVTTGRRLAPAG